MDFSISDEQGNNILEVNKGKIRSKNSLEDNRTTQLYKKVFNLENDPEFILTGGQFTDDGLLITDEDGVKFNRYYSLEERSVKYICKFGVDTVAKFYSDSEDSNFYVDILNKQIYLNSLTKKSISFINAEHYYLIEIIKDYQRHTMRIVDLSTGECDEATYVRCGTGGSGGGEVPGAIPINTGAQRDYYCIGVTSGSNFYIKSMTISALRLVDVIFYGDSITEQSGYFPTNIYHESYLQLFKDYNNGNAMLSGRGGCQIAQVILRVPNEVPFIRPKYAVITIGTNGGNNTSNLSQLVEMLQGYGVIPILNHIPCNESGTQVSVNTVIDQIREKYGLNGCDFDIPTSINFDGQQVDTTKMWKESNIYHHPNVEGGRVMFEWMKMQVPEIFMGTRGDVYGNIGTTVNRPLNVPVGYYYFDTDINKPIWWNGTEWVVNN